MEIIIIDKKICQVEQKLHFHRKGKSIVFWPVREGFLPQYALPPLIAAIDSSARRRYSSGMVRRGDSSTGGGIRHAAENVNSHLCSPRSESV